MKSNLSDKYSSSLVFSGVGDALGWPMEFGRDRPIKEFEPWTKRVGGRYWGYEHKVAAGSYSDDMQLTLCTARSINNKGVFNPELFAYLELPLWVAYEQGGGRATKRAAHALASGMQWNLNFYQSSSSETNKIFYTSSGGNGALMRIMPIILANWHDQVRMIEDVWNNSIVTHGHPRAIVGAFAYAITAEIILRGSRSFLDIHKSLLDFFSKFAKSDFFSDRNRSVWMVEWDRKSNDSFIKVWNNAVNEILHGLISIREHINLDEFEFYKIIGALDRDTKGSGTATFLVCLYMFVKYSMDPYDGLLRIVNTKGSDTDTIASLTCGLWGLLHGSSALPRNLSDGLQDRLYIESVAQQLLSIHEKHNSIHIFENQYSKKDGLLSALAWEIGLHDMFWDALGMGDRISHPIFGAGTIKVKETKPIPRDGYSAKLINVSFDIGQSCWFHSKVKDDGYVENSLQKELKKAIKAIDSMKV
jgi:ADP-ribosylglycohydrolase